MKKEIDTQDNAYVNCETCPICRSCHKRNCFRAQECPLIALFRRLSNE